MHKKRGFKELMLRSYKSQNNGNVTLRKDIELEKKKKKKLY